MIMYFQQEKNKGHWSHTVRTSKGEKQVLGEKVWSLVLGVLSYKGL